MLEDLFWWPSRHPEQACYLLLAGEIAALETAPNMARPYVRGSTGRVAPTNLKEQLALEQAMSQPGAGEILGEVVLRDPRWPASQGWVKMSQRINGIEIHYVQNTYTGIVDDFKFIP